MDEAWRDFLISGKVVDYLKCKGIEDVEDSVEKSDGTEYRSDRDGLKCNADWRL